MPVKKPPDHAGPPGGPPGQQPPIVVTGDGNLDFSLSTGDYTGLLALFEDI